MACHLIDEVGSLPSSRGARCRCEMILLYGNLQLEGELGPSLVGPEGETRGGKPTHTQYATLVIALKRERQRRHIRACPPRPSSSGMSLYTRGAERSPHEHSANTSTNLSGGTRDVRRSLYSWSHCAFARRRSQVAPLPSNRQRSVAPSRKAAPFTEMRVPPDTGPAGGSSSLACSTPCTYKLAPLRSVVP